LVDLGLVGVGESVELLLGAGDLVLGRLAIFLQLVELVSRRAPQIAHGDAALLGLMLHALHELAPTLLVELREHDADDHTVVRRVEAEVGVADRLLDGADLRLVMRVDTSSRASGTLNWAKDCKSMSAPYAWTGSFSISDGFARPVRTVANSA